jgi:hypothetical protein
MEEGDDWGDDNDDALLIAASQEYLNVSYFL